MVFFCESWDCQSHNRKNNFLSCCLYGRSYRNYSLCGVGICMSTLLPCDRTNLNPLDAAMCIQGTENSPHYWPYFKSTCPSDHNVIFIFASPSLWCSKWNHNDVSMMLQQKYIYVLPVPYIRDGHICPSSPAMVKGPALVLLKDCVICH